MEEKSWLGFVLEYGSHAIINIIALPCGIILGVYESSPEIKAPATKAALSMWETTDTFFSAMRVPEGVFDSPTPTNK